MDIVEKNKIIIVKLTSFWSLVYNICTYRLIIVSYIYAKQTLYSFTFENIVVCI